MEYLSADAAGGAVLCMKYCCGAAVGFRMRARVLYIVTPKTLTRILARVLFKCHRKNQLITTSSFLDVVLIS